jgi:hypothetical protein
MLICLLPRCRQSRLELGGGQARGHYCCDIQSSEQCAIVVGHNDIVGSKNGVATLVTELADG